MPYTLNVIASALVCAKAYVLHVCKADRAIEVHPVPPTGKDWLTETHSCMSVSDVLAYNS